MGLSLEKGSKLSLEKSNGGLLNEVLVQLRWRSPSTAYDADASALLLDANKKCLHFTGSEGKRPHFCYYGQPETPYIVSSGDDRGDSGDGDDLEGSEDLVIKLRGMPSEVMYIPIIITLHKAVQLGQSLSDLTNGFITLLDNETQDVLAYGKLSALDSDHISSLFVMIERSSTGWNVNMVNTGYDKDISAWVDLYKVSLG